MSPNNAMEINNDVLRGNNYFYWEFNARMKLARKNLLQYIDGPINVKVEDATAVAEWKANDLRAFAILSTMLITQYQTMVRNSTST